MFRNTNIFSIYTKWPSCRLYLVIPPISVCVIPKTQSVLFLPFNRTRTRRVKYMLVLERGDQSLSIQYYGKEICDSSQGLSWRIGYITETSNRAINVWDHLRKLISHVRKFIFCRSLSVYITEALLWYVNVLNVYRFMTGTISEVLI